MAKGICALEDCERERYAREWCLRHYRRWQRHSDPTTATRVPTTETPDICTVPGCNRPHQARGWCEAHYIRWRRTGSTGDAEMKRPKGAGTIDRGRLKIHAPGHPLANSVGIVPVARAVLFDKIGYGPHLCRWCSTPIHWSIDPRRNGRTHIQADHVDGDTLNDDPANLVQSCAPCNALDGRMAQLHGRKERQA
jgi:hypothetical protein